MEGANEAAIVTRVVLEGSVFMVKIAGRAAMNILAFLAAAGDKALDSAEHMAGKKNLASMLKSGKELTLFTLTEEQMKGFASESRHYGIQYSVVKRSPADKAEGIYDVLCKAEDAVRLNRILERLGVTRVEVTAEGNEATPEQAADSRVSDVRTLMSQMLQPDERQSNPETAADMGNEAQSAAFYQRTADAEPGARRSVKEEMDDINSNINDYPPQQEQNSFADLMSKMFAQENSKDASAGNDTAAGAVSGMQGDKATQDNGKSDVKKPEAGTESRVHREAAAPGSMPHQSADDRERLMKEFEKSYSDLMNGLNGRTAGRE